MHTRGTPARSPHSFIENEMTSPDAKVNLLDLAAASISSVVVAADQIVSFCKPGLSDDAKNIRLKSDGSVVTDADMAAQSIIFQALRNVSMDVRFVGEESPEEVAEQAITGHEERGEAIFKLAQEEIRIRYDRSDEPLPLAQSGTSQATNPVEAPEEPATLLKKLDEYEVDASRVTVIADPLDGTKAYSSGDYAPVSILIGIVLDGVPCFGVICKPFGYPGHTSILDTGCVAIYGGSLLGTVYTAGGSILNLKPVTAEGVLPRAVISSSKSKGVVEQVVSRLGEMGVIDPEPMMVSGAGEKSLRVILRSDNEGLWFYPKSGTSLWDVAASDAILRVTGGRLTDKNGKDIDYSKSRQDALNKNGIVAACDKQIHDTCIRLYLEGTWDEP